jgi:hypothetical protein
MARRLGTVGLLTTVVASCGNGTAAIGPTKPAPLVVFVTEDLSTGARVASVQIYGGDEDVSAELTSTVASRVRVSTWPGDVEIATTESITNISRSQLPNGAIRAAYAQIDAHFDPPSNASTWYALSLPAAPAEYTLPGEPNAFAFDGGARGVRFSPAHAPVVASVMSCTKDGGVVAVYVRYSEPVVRTAGAMPILDYGIPPAGCAIGGDSTTETQFICANAGSGGQPFWLEIPAGITAQASGAAMVPKKLDSTATQTSTTNDGCTVHKPLTAD